MYCFLLFILYKSYEVRSGAGHEDPDENRGIALLFL